MAAGLAAQSCAILGTVAQAGWRFFLCLSDLMFSVLFAVRTETFNGLWNLHIPLTLKQF